MIDTDYIKHKLLKDNKKMTRSKKKVNLFYTYRKVEVMCKNPHMTRTAFTSLFPRQKYP